MQKITKPRSLRSLWITASIPVAIDSTGRTGDNFKVVAYPSYHLIDRNGVLRVADCRPRSVEDAIEFLLDEQPETRGRTVNHGGSSDGIKNPFFD